MKNISEFSKSILSCILLVMFSMTAFSCSDYDYAYVPIDVDTDKPIKYILIHKAKLLPGNEALILTDKSEIQKLTVVLGENKVASHACGYHWMFRFQHSLLTTSIHAHNQECEKYYRNNRKIHKLFQSYFKKIDEQPSHFLYHINVDARYEPEFLVSQLMKNDVYVFFFTNPESRLPHVRLRGIARVKIKKSWSFSRRNEEIEKNGALAIAKLKEVGSELQNKYSIRKITEPQITATRKSYKKDIETEVRQTFEMIIYFDYDQTIEEKDFLKNDVEIVEIKTPLSYRIQLASPVKLNSEKITELKVKYNFIHDIEPFNSNG